MRITGIIEHKVYKHVSGRTASIYGACPWTSQADKANWSLETKGFTWQMSNGTVGFGRGPAKTRGEAEETMRKFNALGRD